MNELVLLDLLIAYDWGVDPKTLEPIDQAVVASHGNAEHRRKLEAELIAALSADIPRAAKDYVCRKLRVIGTDASVPALAALLGDPELSHMARYALEDIPGEKAARALRKAVASVRGAQKIGVIASIGARQEDASVDVLAKALKDEDPGTARAAALALGSIRTAEAAKALAGGSPSAEARAAITDASLACAESLLTEGDKGAALAIYQRLLKGDQPKHVRLAATRGILACKQ